MSNQSPAGGALAPSLRVNRLVVLPLLLCLLSEAGFAAAPEKGPEAGSVCRSRAGCVQVADTAPRAGDFGDTSVAPRVPVLPATPFWERPRPMLCGTAFILPVQGLRSVYRFGIRRIP